MAQYVNKDEAVRILTKIMEQRKKACGRAAIYEATGLQYAIAVINQVQTVELDDEQLRELGQVPAQ